MTPLSLREASMRFLGNIEAKVDAKGRAFMPATFRRELNSSGKQCMVMRKDVFQDCLVLYPESVWNEQMDALRQRLSRWNKTQQQVFRQYVSEVEQVTLDANGRFLLPKRYLNMVGIDKDIRFIGMGDTIELWAAEKTDKPFLEAGEFGQALEGLMNAEQAK